MSKAWARDYNQQGMAVLFPNPQGTGGKHVWDFGSELADNELDTFFKHLEATNQELGEQFNDYFGVTVKGLSSIEYWFSNEQQYKNARHVIDMALDRTKLSTSFRREIGFDFVLLEQGRDY